MKEFDLIARLARQSRHVEGVRTGIGDDAAILEPGRFDLVTVDSMVEGVHYLPHVSDGQLVGWKLLARCLSDIAAMGGAPGPYFMGMCLGDQADEAFVDGLIEGMDLAAEALVPAGFEIGLVGGDTARTSGPSCLTMTMLGESPPAGPVKRSTATPGDRIFVVGTLGHAAAGLTLSQTETPQHEDDEDAKLREALLDAHHRPRAMVREGALMGLHGLATALIDVSDGFAQDLGHVLSASGVGARVSLDRIPIDAGLRRVAAQLELDVHDWVLRGGDDYSLIAAVSPERTARLSQLADEYGFAVTDVGEIREEREGLSVVDAAGEPLDVPLDGYRHVLGREGES